MSRTTRYVIITPARDEARHLAHTVESVLGQSLQPREWIMVDDGSSDATGKLMDRTAEGRPWIRVCHRPDRGRRILGIGVMEAFYDGYELLTANDWEFLVKLDADLSFAPDYFENCFRRFEADPKLGIAGGTVFRMRNGKPVAEGQSDPPFHVRGATKIYRRACWETIGGLFRGTGWDTIDEVKANMFGWRTCTFRDLELLQYRRTGGAEGQWRNAIKNGRANYITGYLPAFMAAKCARRLVEYPAVIGAVGLAWGFFSSYLVREARIPERDVIRYLRGQQMRKLTFRGSIWG